MFGPASVLGTQGVADFTREAIVQVMTFASLSARRHPRNTSNA